VSDGPFEGQNGKGFGEVDEEDEDEEDEELR